MSATQTPAQPPVGSWVRVLANPQMTCGDGLAEAGVAAFHVGQIGTVITHCDDGDVIVTWDDGAYPGYVHPSSLEIVIKAEPQQETPMTTALSNTVTVASPAMAETLNALHAASVNLRDALSATIGMATNARNEHEARMGITGFNPRTLTNLIEAQAAYDAKIEATRVVSFYTPASIDMDAVFTRAINTDQVWFRA